MSDLAQTADGRVTAASVMSFPIWYQGLAASVFWFLTAAVTWGLPDVIPWGSVGLFAAITASGGIVLLALALTIHRLGGIGDRISFWGPWLIALGVWFLLWEFTTAKTGWLPKPFFSPPHGLLQVYVADWSRLLICIGYSLRLWGLGFFSGISLGFVIGVALGWSARFNYWGMPILKLIGPVPATAWIPATFFFFPTTFHASIFLVALSCGIPVAIQTAAGVSQVNRAFYDVARTLGADERFLVLKVAIPASLNHVFVGLFMGLYYSFAVLVVAEMLGAKYGLGWYIAFQSAYSAYANVYATIVIMAVLCSGIVKLLFVARDRLLVWQERGLI